MNEVDVLRAARNLLASGHWHKGSFQDDEGNYCILGALSKVSADFFCLSNSAEHALITHLPEDKRLSFPFTSIHPLAAFNDHPHTTLQDMLDLIDKTLADRGAFW